MTQFGLIGKKLAHSFSKAYFTRKFEELGLHDHIYENFELQSVDEIKNVLSNTPRLKGLNVTIPYKEEILPYLNSFDSVVKETGACNCIKIEHGKTSGFNTDVFGFSTSLQKYLKPHHRSALVLGTGGASKAVQYSLQKMQIPFKVVSRSQQQYVISYDELTENVLTNYNIIINTTPLGMYPGINSFPSLPYHYLNKDHLVFDLIYNPVKTKFLQKGEEAGATIINGYEMLVLQAEESWRIWNS